MLSLLGDFPSFTLLTYVRSGVKRKNPTWGAWSACVAAVLGGDSRWAEVSELLTSSQWMTPVGFARFQCSRVSLKSLNHSKVDLWLQCFSSLLSFP